MMRDLFRSFDREGVGFLLVGGQATVLYGAAHFTTDIDLWVDPRPENFTALLSALARAGARFHKLTPPPAPRWVRKGHGFHFVLGHARRSAVYIDVMGRPPRVGPFATARKRSRRFHTLWGDLPVASIEDLVELKKTNRPGDYEVISRLVRLRLAEEARPGARLVSWAVDNIFRVEDLIAVVAQHADAITPAIARSHPAVDRLLRDPDRADPAAATVTAVGRLLDKRLLAFLDAGRRHWTPRLAELKHLRSTGGLVPVGLPVADLLAQPGR